MTVPLSLEAKNARRSAMFARVVTFNLNTETWDDALATLDTVKGQLETFPGLRSWVSVGNRESGKGVAVAVYENKEALEAVTDQVNEILAGFGAYFTSPPTVEAGDVLAHIDNH